MLDWFRRAATLWRWRREQDHLKSKLLESDVDAPWAQQIPSQAGDERVLPCLKRVGGLDISFFSDATDPDDKRACVAFVVCEFDDADDLQLVWQDFQFVEMLQPYIPGFLAFREAPHYYSMLQRLAAQRPELMPDVTIVDGNGVLHPRGFGVASHVGVLADHCTIGVAKNLHMFDGLEREKTRQLCVEANATGVSAGVPLLGLSGRIWGTAILPQPRKAAAKHSALPPKNPIFVSVGHRVSLETSVAVVNRCLISARVPEPTRLADILSREQVRLVKERQPVGAIAAIFTARRFRRKLKVLGLLVGMGICWVLRPLPKGPVQSVFVPRCNIQLLTSRPSRS